MKTTEDQISEYDLNLIAEHGRIQAKYKFPIALINMYGIREGSKENAIYMNDGISSLSICLDGFYINESTTFWEFSKGSTTVTISKETRRINTYIL